MKQASNTRHLVYPLVLLALSILLSISPLAYQVTRLSWQAREAIAAQDYRRAAALQAKSAEYIPWCSALWEEAGLYALQGGDPQAAARYLAEATTLGSLSSQSQLALAEAYQQTGDFSAAIMVWEAVILQETANADLYDRLYQAHLAIKDYPAAITDLQSLSALQPADAQVYYRLGLLSAALQPTSALMHLDQAASLDPTLSQQVELLASSIRSASNVGDEAYLLLSAGRALASLDEWDLAIEAFYQATVSRSGWAEAWAYLGEARQHTSPNPVASQTEAPAGEPSQSKQYMEPAINEAGLFELQKALELDPTSLSANSFMALFWQRQGQHELALPYLEAAIQKDVHNPALQAQYGDILAVSGDLPSALRAYRYAIELAPHDAIYQKLLVQFSIKYEYQVKEAGLPNALQLVKRYPDDPDILVTIAQALILLGDMDGAMQYLQRALAQDPQYAPAHLYLGLVYLRRGESNKAHEKFSLALSLAAGTPFAEQAQRLLQLYFP